MCQECHRQGKRTLQTLSGAKLTLETELTLGQAVDLVRKAKSSFARDLISRIDRHLILSHNQWVWMYKMAEDQKRFEMAQVQQEAAATKIGDYQALIDLFQRAETHDGARSRTKGLKITFDLGNGQVFQLCKAAKYPGQLYVSNGGERFSNIYYGRIDTEGRLVPNIREATPEWLINNLRDFAANPSEYAQAYGQKSGFCCFCGRKLEDDKGDKGVGGVETTKGSSVEQGYGLSCGRRFGLYHAKLTRKEKEQWSTRSGRQMV
jgi:hypothetical protein